MKEYRDQILQLEIEKKNLIEENAILQTNNENQKNKRQKNELNSDETLKRLKCLTEDIIDQNKLNLELSSELNDSKQKRTILESQQYQLKDEIEKLRSINEGQQIMNDKLMKENVEFQRKIEEISFNEENDKLRNEIDQFIKKEENLKLKLENLQLLIDNPNLYDKSDLYQTLDHILSLVDRNVLAESQNNNLSKMKITYNNFDIGDLVIIEKKRIYYHLRNIDSPNFYVSGDYYNDLKLSK